MEWQFIKYFTIIACSLFLHIKILGIYGITLNKKILSIVFSVVLSLLIYLSYNFSLPIYLRILEMVIFISIFMCIILKTKIDFSVTVSIISLAMSYGFNLISGIIAIYITNFIFSSENMWLAMVITFIIEISIIFFIFRIKRLKKGFQFLYRKETTGVGVIISSIIFICLAMATVDTHNNQIIITLCLNVVFCIIGIIFWWRNRITKLYLERQQKKEVNEVKDILERKNQEIKRLETQNNFLSSIVHRDNKLIPAMAHSVINFMELQKYDENIQSDGEAILTQLTEIMSERLDIIIDNQRKNKLLPLTNVDLLDSTIRYLYNKATQNSIIFDLVITGNIKHMVESVISVSKLQTVLADLIEDAIIAVTDCKYKKILVVIGVSDDYYELSIKDSGILFEIDILLELGKQRVTTYSDKGGSGIGYMTVFDILAQTNSSLIITEFNKENYNFSKCVTIRFDNKRQYIVKSFRSENIKEKCRREDILILK